MKSKLLFKRISRIASTAFSAILLLIVHQSYAQTVTNNTQSTNNGFFYSFWNDGSKGSASMTLGAAGNYSTTWSNIGNFTAGKGWATGKPDRVVCFSGTFNGGSNGFLALYGWTKNALIEYYVCENHGSWTPPGNTSDIVKKGTYTSDGGTYTIYTATRTNQPSIVGTATFQQFWSVRTETRSSGTITFANHVAAWKAAGMNMGSTWDYQIMETEGYNSSGSSNVTVSECTTTCTAPAAPTVTSPVTYCQNAAATALTATGTGLKWYTVATGGTALASAPTPATGSTGTTNYYVSQTSGTCESTRALVAVTVTAAPAAPSVSSPVTYCQNATATVLTGTGTGLKWYTVATGGTALASAPTPITTATGTTNYYVSQTSGTCESTRALIAVTVNELPSAIITVTGNTTIANGQTVTLSASTGTGLSYKWFNGAIQVGTESSYIASTAGNYTVQVTNTALCTSTSTITSITVTQNPSTVITITSIADNANVQAPVTITATVSDPAATVVLVEFLDGNTVIGSTTSAPYSFTWTNPTIGSHTISVRATDALGGVTTSAGVTINTSLATGIQASRNNVYGNVYPIPATDELIVETQLDLTNALFRITNSLGQEISLPIQIEGSDAKINVSDLSAGTYLLMITQDSNILTKKIIISN